MALGIMQGIGEQAKAMAFGADRNDPYGFFGGKGPGIRSAYADGGFAGAYKGMKNWLGIGFEDVKYSRTEASQFLSTIGPRQTAAATGSTALVRRPRALIGEAGGHFKAMMRERDAMSGIFRRRQIGTGIGAGVGLVAAGHFVGYGNMLKGGGMWAGGSMIGGALGATATFGGNAAAGRRIGGRVGLGIYGGYKAGKWAGRKLGMW